MIAAIINKGRMTNKKNLRASTKLFFIVSGLNMLRPILNPSPIDIMTAGSSKIPWGRRRHKTKMPSCLTVWFATKPRRYPLVIAVMSGKIPAKIPRIIEKKLALMLLKKIMAVVA